MIVVPEAPENPLGPQNYRFRRGSKLADMPPVPPQAPVPPLSSLDGPFQLAEYLALKVRHDPHNVKELVDAPSDITKASERHVWVYEHLRRIPIDVTPLITELIELCSRESCPEMKADEWQYLCVAHGGEGTDRCCAIDYILHTLDSTSSLLNSSKYFPSRLQIPDASLSHFPSLFRRLSRIFSHAYFHHREAFATSEAETSLYRRFVALCHKYELVGPSLLIIPQEGYEGISAGDDDEDHSRARENGGAEDDDWDDGNDEDKGNSDDDDESSRGRENDPAGLGRSHSLGRHAAFSPGQWSSSPVQPANKGKPAPAQASESLSPPSTRAQLDMTDPVIPTTVQGRGTLSRGKGSRGSTANMWAQEPPSADGPASVPEDVPASVAGMARKESVDSVVHVGSSDAPVDPSPAPDSDDSKPETSPSADSLTLDTDTEAPGEEKSTPLAEDSSSLPTPVSTDSSSLPPLPKSFPCPPSPTPEATPEPPIPAMVTEEAAEEEEGLPVGTSSPVLENNKTTTLATSPKITSPTKADSTSPIKSISTSPKNDLFSYSPKSQLSSSRPAEILVSPKSELKALSPPKSELLSASPKPSPAGATKRGGRAGGKGAKPKSPTKASPAKPIKAGEDDSAEE